MFDNFESAYKGGDTRIDIIGFSRGAAMAREFSNMVADKYPKAKINFVGLFDTVASFGMGGNDVNLGYRMGMPSTVKNAYHITAQQSESEGERRFFFPLGSIKSAANAKLPGGWTETGFVGAHSDVGGGYKEGRGLANRALSMMHAAMKASGAPMKPLGDLATYGDNVTRIHDSRWPNDKAVEAIRGEARNRQTHYYPVREIAPYAAGYRHGVPVPEVVPE